jgi:hypothetical protein
MLLNIKGNGSNVAMGQCGCCAGKRGSSKMVRVEKTFDGACEEVVGELKKFYGEPREALAEVTRAIVMRLGFGGER